MKNNERRNLIVLVVSVLAFILLLTVAAQAARSDPPSGAAPALAPTCTTHTTAMTLTVSDMAPQVGDEIVVTSTLANRGCSDVGLLEYRLRIQPDGPPPSLVPNPPLPISHTLSITPGASDAATFTFHVLGSGPVTLTSSASFEVHLGYPGPSYWASDSSRPLTLTVPVTDTEVVVLHQAAYEFSCFPDISIISSTYRSDCVFAAGHSTDTRIERFADEAEAQAAFEDARGSHALETLRCYSAFSWSEEQDTMPKLQRGHTWVAGRWLITAHSVDDTDIPVAPDPAAVSEEVYKAAVVNRLLPSCDAIYLPLILKGP